MAPSRFTRWCQIAGCDMQRDQRDQQFRAQTMGYAGQVIAELGQRGSAAEEHDLSRARQRHKRHARHGHHQ